MREGEREESEEKGGCVCKDWYQHKSLFQMRKK
jgi:hypothetical protein